MLLVSMGNVGVLIISVYCYVIVSGEGCVDTSCHALRAHMVLNIYGLLSQRRRSVKGYYCLRRRSYKRVCCGDIEGVVYH